MDYNHLRRERYRSIWDGPESFIKTGAYLLAAVTLKDVHDHPGHPVLNPEGRLIYVPKFVMISLRRMGLLTKNREQGLRQISPRIYFFLTHYPIFLDSRSPAQMRAKDFRNLPPTKKSKFIPVASQLGIDCSGPQVVTCTCKECQAKHDTYTPLPYTFNRGTTTR